jgi:frataxin-like iron-binding protein CyaY
MAAAVYVRNGSKADMWLMSGMGGERTQGLLVQWVESRTQDTFYSLVSDTMVDVWESQSFLLCLGPATCTILT